MENRVFLSGSASHGSRVSRSRVARVIRFDGNRYWDRRISTLVAGHGGLDFPWATGTPVPSPAPSGSRVSPLSLSLSSLISLNLSITLSSLSLSLSLSLSVRQEEEERRKKWREVRKKKKSGALVYRLSVGCESRAESSNAMMTYQNIHGYFN